VWRTTVDLDCPLLTHSLRGALLGHVFICTDVEANRQPEAPSKEQALPSSSSPLRKAPSKPIRTLDAFQRVELEVLWRKLEDAFVPSLQSVCSSRTHGDLADQLQDFSSQQTRIRQPFNLMREYVRLGASLPREMIPLLTPSHNQIDADTSNMLKPRVGGGVNQSDLTSPVCISTNTTQSGADEGVAAAENAATEAPPGHPYHFQSKWRISAANQLYNLCFSYPQMLVVPSAISDAHLAISSKQRSAQRIPALTWIHPDNGAALCR
jgi:hypothetical protein